MIKIFTQNQVLALASLLFCAASVQAQSSSSDAPPAERQNIIKWNVAALAFKSYSFQYERAVSKRISVSLGYRFMPKSGVPFKSTINDLVDDEQTVQTINDFKTSNYAITPEVRYYVGSKGVFHGFYLAPFIRYAKYNAEGPFKYTVAELDRTESIYFKGDVNTFTGGLMIGAQWQLSKLIYLDWWIVGASYGSSNGSLIGQKTMDALEQAVVQHELDNFVEDLPILDATAHVNGNGANINFKGPWAGARAGLNIGFRF